MSVLIKGMEMPRVCAECFMDPPCMKAFNPFEVNIWKERHPDCPLIEVKEPHGRLGDLDVLAGKVAEMMQEPDYQHDGENWFVGLIMASDAIQETETIVEAEGSEE